MASSGKKGKKSKGTVISLQSFLSNGDVPVGTTQVAKNIRSVDGEDSDDGGNVLTVVCQLPTAPRANRIFDDNSIPHKLPFIAYVTNLPFDVKEEDLYEFFNKNKVKSVRLPREDGDTGRVRGFGYVEFESREDLIESLAIPDPTIKGRRIRIDLSNEHEQHVRQRGARRGFDSGGSNNEGRESSNWRRENNTKRDSYIFGVERKRIEDQTFISDESNSAGSWRKKIQPTSMTSSSFELLHQKDRDEYNNDKNNTLERPKLVLKPRTLPLPELDVPVNINLESKLNDIKAFKFTGTPAQKVFGSARPVDTTARDLEIEERLADERRQDNLRMDNTRTKNETELSIVKDGQIKTIDQNWRRQNEDVETLNNQDKNIFRSDIRREKEYRKKYQDKSEGVDHQKAKDIKRKDVAKIKREFKVDHKWVKSGRNQNETVVSSNKYSGLDDGSD